MNTIQLECFVVVAQYLNFSRASEDLKITQPAVSHQIRTLEEELGVKLFKRTSKSVSLTPEGIQFYPDAELILKTAMSAKKRLGVHENFVPFEVGCCSCPELNLFPPVFKQLAREFPLLRPSVRLVPSPSLPGLLDHKKIPASFQIKERQTKSSLCFRELGSASVACICAPEHPLAQYETLSRNQLSGSIIVSSPRQIPGALFAIQNQILSQLPPQEHYATETLESVFTLAKAQLGYTLYPDLPMARDPGLCYIPVTDFPRLPFGIYYHRDNDHPVLKRFLTVRSETFSGR